MENNGFGFLERLEHGLYGDICVELAGRGKAAADMNPDSVYFFALWQVCKEIGWHFRDHQAVRFEEAVEVNRHILGPLSRLIQLEGFDKETEDSVASLQILVRNLHGLRLASELRR